jgi:hypothetical protein
MEIEAVAFLDLFLVGMDKNFSIIADVTPEQKGFGWRRVLPQGWPSVKMRRPGFLIRTCLPGFLRGSLAAFARMPTHRIRQRRDEWAFDAVISFVCGLLRL